MSFAPPKRGGVLYECLPAPNSDGVQDVDDPVGRCASKLVVYPPSLSADRFSLASCQKRVAFSPFLDQFFIVHFSLLAGSPAIRIPRRGRSRVSTFRSSSGGSAQIDEVQSLPEFYGKQPKDIPGKMSRHSPHLLSGEVKFGNGHRFSPRRYHRL